MRRIVASSIVTIVPLLFAGSIMAEGPSMEPGKWEFKTTASMPMMSEPKVTTKTECVTEEEATKDPLAAMVEDINCKVLSREESGDTIEFEVECEGDMDTKMKGKGKCTADGTSASGNMEMTMEMPQMGGQTMKMTQEWEGRRIGDCD